MWMEPGRLVLGLNCSDLSQSSTMGGVVARRLVAVKRKIVRFEMQELERKGGVVVARVTRRRSCSFFGRSLSWRRREQK